MASGSDQNGHVSSPTVTPQHVDNRITRYSPWKPHTQVILECDTATYTSITARHHPRAAPHCRWQRYHTSRTPHPPTPHHTPSSTTTICMYVERLLTRNVAVLLDCNNAAPARWTAKFYPCHWPLSCRLADELSAYEKCYTIQGTELPFFYGAWTIHGTPPEACKAVLTELIEPGITVASLQDKLKTLPEGFERREARFRLAELHSSATRAVDKLNECGVAHNSLDGENMLLAGERGEECVVLVNFGWAMVFEEGRATYEAWWGFHSTFMT